MAVLVTVAMPELPGPFFVISLRSLLTKIAEVERAVQLLLSIAVGKKICKVDSVEDKLVFAQTSHEQFVCFNNVVGLAIYVYHSRLPRLREG